MEKVKNSITALFFITLTAVLFFSCAQPVSEKTETQVTLRSVSETIENEIQWTAPLEGDRLSTKITAPKQLASSIASNPDNAVIIDVKDFEPVYPVLKGFTSLDLSGLSSKQLEFINSFLKKFIAGDDVDSYMDTSKIHQLVLFRYDLNEIDLSAVDSYVLGKPFIGDDYIQCPVRFRLNGDHSVDFNIYLSTSDENCSITQFELLDSSEN